MEVKPYKETNNYLTSFTLEMRRGHIYNKILTQYVSEIPVGARILHVGCNNGSTTALIAELFPTSTVIGMDINEAAITLAHLTYPDRRIQFQTGDLSDFDTWHIDDDSIDVVVAFDVLEHIYPHDIDVVMCNLKRVLKQGGMVWAVVPRADGGDPESLQTAYDSEHRMFFPNYRTVRALFHICEFFKPDVMLINEPNPDQLIAPGRHNMWFVEVSAL